MCVAIHTEYLKMILKIEPFLSLLVDSLVQIYA